MPDIIGKIFRGRLIVAAMLFMPLALFLFFVFGLGIEPVLAQQEGLDAVAEASILPQGDLTITIARLIRTFLGVLGIILVIIIIYAGWLYMTSAGDAGKIKKAVDIIKNAVIGLIIILASFAIAQFVLNALLGDGGPGGSINFTQEQIVGRFSEPRASSLGAGIVEDHFPARSALDVPRNTRIFVTFKEPIDPASIIDGYESDPTSQRLKSDNVLIYASGAGVDTALAPEQVAVFVNEDFTVFTFDPVELLGSPNEDTNYTVFLTPDIRLEDGSEAFVGNQAEGYEWTFEVSTVVDLTPPQVQSWIPVQSGSPYAMNIMVEITFNEAMDPIATTGTFDSTTGEDFNHISVLAGGVPVDGVFTISNHYKTISFQAFDACAKDPCGNIIYCLPASSEIQTVAIAAGLSNQPPQAELINGTFDGVVDASGNSLDGNENDTADGTGVDNFTFNFSTSANKETASPHISKVLPEIIQSNVDVSQDVEIFFDTLISSLSINSTNASLWPDPYYPMWFVAGKKGLDKDELITEESSAIVATMATISHPTLVSGELEGWDYYPVITNGIKSAYQICMHPTSMTTGSCKDLPKETPYCCNGQPSAGQCLAPESGTFLPDTSK